MPGSLTSGVRLNRWQGKHFRHTSACTTHNFTYLVRGSYDKYLYCYLQQLCIYGCRVFVLCYGLVAAVFIHILQDPSVTYDCPSATEAITKMMGKYHMEIISTELYTKQNNHNKTMLVFVRYTVPLLRTFNLRFPRFGLQTSTHIV